MSHLWGSAMVCGLPPRKRALAMIVDLIPGLQINPNPRPSSTMDGDLMVQHSFLLSVQTGCR